MFGPFMVRFMIADREYVELRSSYITYQRVSWITIKMPLESPSFSIVLRILVFKIDAKAVARWTETADLYVGSHTHYESLCSGTW